jgi:hypothetical protein
MLASDLQHCVVYPEATDCDNSTLVYVCRYILTNRDEKKAVLDFLKLGKNSKSKNKSILSQFTFDGYIHSTSHHLAVALESESSSKSVSQQGIRSSVRVSRQLRIVMEVDAAAKQSEQPKKPQKKRNKNPKKKSNPDATMRKFLQKFIRSVLPKLKDIDGNFTKPRMCTVGNNKCQLRKGSQKEKPGYSLHFDFELPEVFSLSLSIYILYIQYDRNQQASGRLRRILGEYGDRSCCHHRERTGFCQKTNKVCS